MMKKILIGILCVMVLSTAIAVDEDYCEQGDKVIVCYIDGKVSEFINPIINKVTDSSEEAMVLNAELSIIDEEFIEEFNSYVQEADEEELGKIKAQLEDYVSSIKDELTELEDTDIQELRDEKIDVEELMKRAWRE